MAPTLQGVSFLVGLPLAGEAVSPLELPPSWHADMVERFSVVAQGIQELVPDANGPMWRWLRQFQVVALFANFFTGSLVNILMYFSVAYRLGS